jgi:hypothetical protein
MSDAKTSAGTKLYVSAAQPATYDAAGYAALSWTEVGEVISIPEFGKTYALVTHNPLGERKTFKRKGSYNEGNLSCQVARVPGDAGQAICITAVDSDDPVSFKVDFEDGVTTNTLQNFSGLVMSYTTNTGSSDQIRTAMVSIEIDGDIVEVAAT